MEASCARGTVTVLDELSKFAFRYCCSAAPLPALVVTVHATLFHGRPPLPVVDDRSILRLLQPPTCDGATKTMLGSSATVGGSTFTTDVLVA